jgi:hypothetical protein
MSVICRIEDQREDGILVASAIDMVLTPFQFAWRDQGASVRTEIALDFFVGNVQLRHKRVAAARIRVTAARPFAVQGRDVAAPGAPHL